MESHTILTSIKSENWSEFQTEFMANNFYRKLIRCPQTNSLTSEEKEAIKNLQQRIWKDALSALEELFEVDDYKKISWIYTYYVYKFLKTRYTTSHTLIKEIRQTAHEILDIRIDDSISLYHKIENGEFF